ncbi:MAG: acyl-CoA dehydrogenase family protein [Ornithinimicrobium sp.]
MPITTVWNSPAWADSQIADRLQARTTDVDDALELATELSALGSMIGRDTWPVLSALATIGSVDLSAARVVEPHLDAHAIIDQARSTDEPALRYADHATWGVYAASPPGTRVHAKRASATGGWTVTGAKPWCSLADRVSHALITASRPGGRQQLFAVPMRQASVDPQMSHWKAHGLPHVSTGTVHLNGAEAHPVGPPGWYLDRPGFAWGGVAVAAIWFGAAAAVAGALWDAARDRAPDQIALMHLGSCDAALHSALLALQAAATAMDHGVPDAEKAAVLAARTRACVAEVAERVLTTVGHALGPGPLAFDQPHLQRVADLTLYLRQHHAERDQARLGALVAPPTKPAPTLVDKAAS